MRFRPLIHGRDHEHGGADVTRIVYEDVGTSGGGGDGGGATGIFMDTPGGDQEGGYLEIIGDDGDINILSSGGNLILNDTTDTAWLKNSGEGVIVYGTGHFSTGRITDLDSALLETGADKPSVIIAGSNGVVISQAAIDVGDTTGTLNLVFLFCDTGNNLVRSPAILARTTDPHIAGALWNSAGTVKISSG